MRVNDSSDPIPSIQYYKQERMGKADKCIPSGMSKSFMHA